MLLYIQQLLRYSNCSAAAVSGTVLESRCRKRVLRKNTTSSRVHTYGLDLYAHLRDEIVDNAIMAGCATAQGDVFPDEIRLNGPGENMN